MEELEGGLSQREAVHSWGTPSCEQETWREQEVSSKEEKDV